jgi:hypothetical protein
LVEDGETTIRADLLEVERRIGGFRWREKPNKSAIASATAVSEAQQ